MIRITTTSTIMTIDYGPTQLPLSGINIVTVFYKIPNIIIATTQDVGGNCKFEYDSVLSFNGVAPTSPAGLVADMLAFVSSSCGSMSVVTNTTVITAITNEANWVNGDFVDPGGILALMSYGNYYLDTFKMILYQYIEKDGAGRLIRTSVNTSESW